MYAHLDTTDPTDREVIIKIDISNAFNTLCRALVLDIINGKATRDYACRIKANETFESACDRLRPMFGDDCIQS